MKAKKTLCGKAPKMTQQEKQKRIAALAAEIAELMKPEKTAGQRFWELVSGTEIKFDFKKYPCTLFGFRDGEYVWEFDFRNNYLWLRYSTVWSVLGNEYGLNYDDVESLVKNEVEERFKCRGVTPFEYFTPSGSEVESHFKCRGVTVSLPRFPDELLVEEHFKCREVTKVARQVAEDVRKVLEKETTKLRKANK